MASNKDWTGNKSSAFVCNGATGHGLTERQKEACYKGLLADAELREDIIEDIL